MQSVSWYEIIVGWCRQVSGGQLDEKDRSGTVTRRLYDLDFATDPWLLISISIVYLLTYLLSLLTYLHYLLQ